MKLQGCIVVLTTLSALVVPAAGVEPLAKVKLSGLRAYLEEFSGVLDVGDERGREYVSTRLAEADSEGSYLLVYERKQYDSVESRVPSSRQIIHYPFEFGDLNVASLEVREWTGALSGDSYYLVVVRIQSVKKFIDYSNIVETRLEDGKVDVTSSQGKARSLVMGYFRNEQEAKTFADAFRDVMANSDSRAEVTEPAPDPTPGKD